MESEKIAKRAERNFQRLKECKAFKTELKNSLELLTRMMQIHYGRPVILLLDEYDVPIAKASSNGYYKEMLEVMKAMLGSSLKDNPSVKFAVITGCLKVAKESIFTGTNNFVSDSILSFGFSEYFGFTQKKPRNFCWMRMRQSMHRRSENGMMVIILGIMIFTAHGMC